MKQHRIGERGQVVIPMAERQRLGLTPGTPVDFQADEDGVTVRPARVSIEALTGTLADGPDMAAALLVERAAESR